MSIRIGADPEFKLRGYEAEWFLRGNGLFGRDGCPSICEMRPPAAKSALELVGNIVATVDEALQEVPVLEGIEWLAGHYKEGFPIGGHVHLSGLGDVAFTALTEALNAVLYDGLSEAIDAVEERAQREQQYGRRAGNEWREQGPGYMEYRVPGSWLLSPDVAFMNLWLAEAVAKEACAAMEAGKSQYIPNLRNTGAEGVMEFFESCSARTKEADGELFKEVADRVFGMRPLRWDVDFKEAWLL